MLSTCSYISFAARGGMQVSASTLTCKLLFYWKHFFVSPPLFHPTLGLEVKAAQDNAPLHSNPSFLHFRFWTGVYMYSDEFYSSKFEFMFYPMSNRFVWFRCFFDIIPLNCAFSKIVFPPSLSSPVKGWQERKTRDTIQAVMRIRKIASLEKLEVR